MIDLQILNLVLDKKDYSIIVNNGLTEDYFPEYKEEFNFIKDHYDKYKIVPDKETFVNKFQNFNFFNVYEKPEFLIKGIKEEYIYLKTVPIIQKVDQLLTGENADSNKAVEYLVQKLPSLTELMSFNAIDLVKQAEQRYNAYEIKCEKKEVAYISTGLKELDEIIGGWDCAEELAVISARTNQGKSWWLDYFLLKALQQGKRVGLYSGEMTPDKVGYRVDTFMSNISNFKMVHGHSDIKEQYREHIEHFKKLSGSFFIITPKELGGPATVEKLKAFVQKYNIELLGIDQFSLMEDSRKGRQTFEKYANISMDLKTMQMQLRIPILAVSQLNRAASGGKDKTETEIGTENLSYSDRIGQDATTVLSIQQKEQGLELKIVKARDSKVGDKLTYHWDIDKGVLNFIPTANDATRGKYVEEVKEQFEKDGTEVF